MNVHVAELALRLHATGKPDLRLALQAGEVVDDDTSVPGYTVREDVIEFASLSDRNRLVAAREFGRLGESLATKPDELFAIARELWRNEIGHADYASGRLLALASNEVDVLSHASQRIRSGGRVFEVLHLLEAGLPHFERLNLDSLLELCDVKHEQTKNDLAGGMFHGAIETWLSSRPEAARQLHALATENLREATASLLGNAALALAKTDYAAAAEIARSDAADPSALRAGTGVWSLGRLLLEEDAPTRELAATAASVMSLIETAASGDLRARAIRAATNAMHRSSTFDELLKRLARAGDQDVLAGVASTVFVHPGDMMRRGDLADWLDLLTGLEPARAHMVGELDNALARLAKDPSNLPMVIETLTKWVTRHGKRAAVDGSVSELFNSTVAELVEHETVCSGLITRWLLSNEQAHAACLAGVLMSPLCSERKTLLLDMSQVDVLEAETLLFLARRMLGYVFDRAQVTSLALSMLRSREAKTRIFPLLGNLLVKEIGYDYPGSTRQACELALQSSKSAEEQQFLRDASNALAQADRALDALPRRKELEPPMRLRRLFALARAKQMSRAMEEAQKKSVLRQLVTEIPIKAGRGTFSYREDNYGPGMKLSPISHSVELPRREVLDPIGNAIRSLQFRLVKRSAD